MASASAGSTPRTFPTAGRPASSSRRPPRTLFTGDLFTAPGDGPAITDADIVEPAIAGEEMFHATAVTPNTAPTIRRLAELDPATLALMHGPAFTGDGGAALGGLASYYETSLNEQVRAISADVSWRPCDWVYRTGLGPSDVSH